MAKYAVLSDIHGNADAFEAVLAKCAEISVDKYICLGDVVGYNAEPSRCIQMAKELNFIAQVRGNHDEYAVRGAPELSGFNENAKIAIMWTRHQLSDDELDWLDGFFREEHHDIREGECSLTDLWFEFCARKMAKERGVDVNDEAAMQVLLDEAWDNCPPDPSIDFRMSFDKNLKYRI